MIPEELALNLIKRFAALRGWRGMESAAKAELGRWLAKTAETPWQATQAVETWLQEQTNLPTPAEIVEYVRQAPTQAPKQQKVNCPICHGDGYESFWALINYEFWEDTGRVKSRRIERIPPVPGQEQFYLIVRPDLEAQVDGRNQKVAMTTGYCGCETGQRVKRATEEYWRESGRKGRRTG